MRRRLLMQRAKHTEDDSSRFKPVFTLRDSQVLSLEFQMLLSSTFPLFQPKYRTLADSPGQKRHLPSHSDSVHADSFFPTILVISGKMETFIARVCVCVAVVSVGLYFTHLTGKKKQNIFQQ